MTANEISKYSKYSVPELIKKVQVEFNKFIRNRDEGQPCINCGKFRKLQAGHFFPTSTHSHLRFDEFNVSGECLSCNYYNSQSHSYGYAINLEKKIGEEEFKKLHERAIRTRNFKWDRYTLIEKLLHYKQLNK